jgi:hypothetical protein
MSGYLDSGGGTNQIAINVAGLPSTFTAGGYDVYVYFNSDSAGTQGFSATDNLANSDSAFGQQVGGAGTNYPLGGPNGFIVSTATTAGTAIPANAVLLEGLTGPNFTLTGINTAIGDGRARINGFQIVSNQEVPEPASVAIWSFLGVGLAGFGYLRLRRKK